MPVKNQVSPAKRYSEGQHPHGLLCTVFVFVAVVSSHSYFALLSTQFCLHWCKDIKKHGTCCIRHLSEQGILPKVKKKKKKIYKNILSGAV